jgi:hypothetical protein
MGFCSSEICSTGFLVGFIRRYIHAIYDQKSSVCFYHSMLPVYDFAHGFSCGILKVSLLGI